MKKLFGFVLLAFLFSSGVQAQLLKFGARAGVSSSSITADDLVIKDQAGLDQLRVKAENAVVGMHFGVMAQINLPLVPVMIIPELLYSSTGGEVKVAEIENGSEVREIIKEQRFGRLDIPIMAAYKFGPARIQAGPIASINLSENNGLFDAVKETVNNADVAEEKINAATWGFQAGVGVNLLKKIAIDLKYEGSLSKLGDGVTVFGNKRTFDSRTNQFILSVGYLF